MKQYAKIKDTRREKPVSEIAIEKCGFYLADHARYNYLLNLPEEQDIAKAIKKAMEAIEEYKPELKGILPRDEYFRLTRTDKTIPMQLLKNFSDIPEDAAGDMFGHSQQRRYCHHPPAKISRRNAWNQTPRSHHFQPQGALQFYGE